MSQEIMYSLLMMSRVTLNSTLTFDQHVVDFICSCHYHCITYVHSWHSTQPRPQQFPLSKADSIDRLQNVQNILMQFVAEAALRNIYWILVARRLDWYKRNIHKVKIKTRNCHWKSKSTYGIIRDFVTKCACKNCWICFSCTQMAGQFNISLCR